MCFNIAKGFSKMRTAMSFINCYKMAHIIRDDRDYTYTMITPYYRTNIAFDSSYSIDDFDITGREIDKGLHLFTIFPISSVHNSESNSMGKITTIIIIQSFIDKGTKFYINPYEGEIVALKYGTLHKFWYATSSKNLEKWGRNEMLYETGCAEPDGSIMLDGYVYKRKDTL